MNQPYTPETIDACIAELKTEIRFRQIVYSKKVRDKKMPQSAMDLAIKKITDTIHYLEHLKRVLIVAKLGIQEGSQQKLF